MKDLINNKAASNPLMFGLIIIPIVPMAMGISFAITFLILTAVTILAVYANKGTHKVDLIYIAIAYLILLGYLFPDFINLGS